MYPLCHERAWPFLSVTHPHWAPHTREAQQQVGWTHGRSAPRRRRGKAGARPPCSAGSSLPDLNQVLLPGQEHPQPGRPHWTRACGPGPQAADPGEGGVPVTVGVAVSLARGQKGGQAPGLGYLDSTPKPRREAGIPRSHPTVKLTGPSHSILEPPTPRLSRGYVCDPLRPQPQAESEPETSPCGLPGVGRGDLEPLSPNQRPCQASTAPGPGAEVEPGTQSQGRHHTCMRFQCRKLHV